MASPRSYAALLPCYYIINANAESPHELWMRILDTMFLRINTPNHNRSIFDVRYFVRTFFPSFFLFYFWQNHSDASRQLVYIEYERGNVSIQFNISRIMKRWSLECQTVEHGIFNNFNIKNPLWSVCVYYRNLVIGFNAPCR